MDVIKIYWNIFYKDYVIFLKTAWRTVYHAAEQIYSTSLLLLIYLFPANWALLCLLQD